MHLDGNCKSPIIELDLISMLLNDGCFRYDCLQLDNNILKSTLYCVFVSDEVLEHSTSSLQIFVWKRLHRPTKFKYKFLLHYVSQGHTSDNTPFFNCAKCRVSGRFPCSSCKHYTFFNTAFGTGWCICWKKVCQSVVSYFHFFLLLKMPVLGGPYNGTDVMIEVLDTLKDLCFSFKTQDINVSFLLELHTVKYILTEQELETLSSGENHRLRNGWSKVHVEQLGEPSCQQKAILSLNKKIKLCPYIKIPFHEVSMEIQNNFLYFNETGTKLKKSECVKKGDIVYLCLLKYRSVYLALHPPRDVRKATIRRTITGPKDILSFVCVCLSLVCLLITLATYIFLKELQTQPRINTIILCVFLLLAQGMYQFGAGQSSLHSYACS